MPLPFIHSATRRIRLRVLIGRFEGQRPRAFRGGQDDGGFLREAVVAERRDALFREARLQHQHRIVLVVHEHVAERAIVGIEHRRAQQLHFRRGGECAARERPRFLAEDLRKRNVVLHVTRLRAINPEDAHFLDVVRSPCDLDRVPVVDLDLFRIDGEARRMRTRLRFDGLFRRAAVGAGAVGAAGCEDAWACRPSMCAEIPKSRTLTVRMYRANLDSRI